MIPHIPPIISTLDIISLPKALAMASAVTRPLPAWEAEMSDGLITYPTPKITRA